MFDWLRGEEGRDAFGLRERYPSLPQEDVARRSLADALGFGGLWNRINKPVAFEIEPGKYYYQGRYYERPPENASIIRPEDLGDFLPLGTVSGVARALQKAEENPVVRAKIYSWFSKPKLTRYVGHGAIGTFYSLGKQAPGTGIKKGIMGLGMERGSLQHFARSFGVSSLEEAAKAIQKDPVLKKHIPKIYHLGRTYQLSEKINIVPWESVRYVDEPTFRKFALDLIGQADRLDRKLKRLGLRYTDAHEGNIVFDEDGILKIVDLGGFDEIVSRRVPSRRITSCVIRALASYRDDLNLTRYPVETMQKIARAYKRGLLDDKDLAKPEFWSIAKRIIERRMENVKKPIPR